MVRRKSSSSRRRTSSTRRRRSTRSLSSILLSELRRRFTRSTGIPTTRAGAERKLGSLLIGLIVGLFTRKRKKTASAPSASASRGQSVREREEAARQDIGTQLDARESHATAYAEAEAAVAGQENAQKSAPSSARKSAAEVDDILNINPPD